MLRAETCRGCTLETVVWKKTVCSACLAALQSVRFAEASLSILWLPACVLFLQPGCQNNKEVRNMVSPCSFSQLSQTKTLSCSLPPVFLWSGTIASFLLYGSVYLAIRHQFISCNCSVKSAIYTSAHLVGIAGRRSGNYRLGLTPFCWRDELEADGVHNQMSEIARYLSLFFFVSSRERASYCTSLCVPVQFANGEMRYNVK